MSTHQQRLSLSRILEMVLTRGGERSSVSLARAASGETIIDVKVRTGDDDVQTLEQAGAKAQAEYDRLVALYPYSPSHDGADLTLTRNAKGETQVAVSMKSSERLPTVEAVGEAAQAEYDRLRGVYPMSSGASAKAGSVEP